MKFSIKDFFSKCDQIAGNCGENFLRSENERLLLSASFTAKLELVFVSTQESAFS